MKYELKHLSFGETLGQTFRLYFDNFIQLFLISLVSYLPAIILSSFSNPSTKFQSVLSTILVLLVNIGTSILCSALTIELISKKYLAKPQGIGQYLRNVLPLVLPVFGLMIIILLMIAAPFFLLGLTLGVRAAMLIFFIPGIWIYLTVILSSQALIVERIGIFQSLRRSADLTKYNKWMIFGYIFLIIILNRFMDQVILSKIALPAVFQLNFAHQTRIFLAYCVYYLGNILITPISACMLILIYFNLRIEKESFDLEHLVDQFDSSEPEPIEN